MKTITWCYSGTSRMGNIKYKDEMDLIYMLIDLTGIKNIREQDEPDIGIMQSVVVQKHIDGIERSQRPLTAVLRTSNNTT